MTQHIDIHIIQSVPPSNLNRDDTGSPKTAMYGGVRRARVSSQAWKRATRRDFDKHLDRANQGVLTRRAVTLLGDRIIELNAGLANEANELALAVLKAAGIETKGPRKGSQSDAPLTEALVFFSQPQLDALARIATEGPRIDRSAAKAAIKSHNSFGLALFGRMVALKKGDKISVNVDAACQVAHAISTHAIETEFDYFTGVDDDNPDDETGAGMVGNIEFDSATLYRYATVSLAGLRENLGDDTGTVRAIEAFVRSFVTSMPTGKSNTFANRTLPDAVLVMARQDRPVSLVGAFEDAVRGTDGFVRASCEALAEYAGQVETAYGNPPTRTWVTRVGKKTDPLSGFGDSVSIDELVRGVGEYAGQALEAKS